MSNGFDCNINSPSINNINKVKSKNTEPEKNGIQNKSEYTEGSSLDLSPATIVGRSMVSVNKPLTQEQIREKAEKLLNRFVQQIGTKVHPEYKTPDSSVFSGVKPEDIIRLEPILKKIKLDISTPERISYMRDMYGYEVEDENIKKTADVLGDINENSKNIVFIRDFVKHMIFSYDNNFNKFNKWIHYLNDIDNVDIEKLPCTHDNIYKILFGDLEDIERIDGKGAIEQLKFFEQLIENKEIIDAIKNFEIDATNKIGYFDKSKYNENEYKEMEKIHELIPDGVIVEGILQLKGLAPELLATNNKKELFGKLNTIQKMKEKTLSNPELYLNGDDTNPRMIEAKIQDFYDNHSTKLLRLVSSLDKEAIDVLMRKRFDAFEEYLDTIKNFTFQEMNLLKDLANSVNLDGKPFLPTQKVELIDLIAGYKNNDVDMTKMYQMIENGKINLGELKLDLFNKIMKNAGMTEEEIAMTPKEKLLAWDTRYAHLLAKGYEETDSDFEVDEKGYNDVIRAANLCDFEEYIHDESNEYGQANANTKGIFKDMGMDYEKWIHPSKDFEINFVSKDKNEEKLLQVAKQIAEDMNTLMKTPVKGHIKKQFPAFVKGDEFFIPEDYLKNKTKLQTFVNSLIDESEDGKMAPVWKRAKGNLNTDKAKFAMGTLTVLDHFKQREADLEKIENAKIEKNLNWKIKMWDRVPQKDLFQGNYSTCCIGVGHGNGHAMPHYLMNTAFNMIEIFDNNTDKTVGNALCYFVKTDDGKPALVLDNVEIDSSEKPSDKPGKSGEALREKIFEYAKNIAKDVTGRDDVPVFLSDQYNDIPFNDLPSHREKITFLGDIDCENIYLDMFSAPAEWTNKEDFTQERKVLTLE